MNPTIFALGFSGGAPLTDPLGSSALVAAIQWLQSTLLGSIAVSVAVIAVAVVGLSMLSGRIPLRLGATVLAGCFVLFGASTIAAGLERVVGAPGEFPLPDDYSFAHQPPVAPPPPDAPPTAYDPYAGASITEQ